MVRGVTDSAKGGLQCGSAEFERKADVGVADGSRDVSGECVKGGGAYSFPAAVFVAPHPFRITGPVAEAAAAPPARLQKPSPEYTASWVSKVLFSWMTPLFIIGNARPLEEADLYGVAGEDAPSAVSSAFEAHLHAALASGEPGATYRALVVQFWRPMAVAGVFKFVNSTLNFAPLLLLYYLLANIAARSAGSTTDTAGTGYILAAAMFVSIVLRTLNENYYFSLVLRVGFRIRAALTAAVYRKALRMTPAARSEAPTGQVVNLMQIDASRIDTLMMQLHVLWDSPYQALGYMVLLGVFIGVSALAGLATMLVLIPLQGFMMAAMGRHRRAVTKANDARMKLTNEALQSVRAAKLYSWEGAIHAAIGRAREAELGAITSYSVLQSVNVTLMTVSPIVVAVVRAPLACAENCIADQARAAHTASTPAPPVPPGDAPRLCIRARLVLHRGTRLLRTRRPHVAAPAAALLPLRHRTGGGRARVARAPRPLLPPAGSGGVPRGRRRCGR